MSHLQEHIDNFFESKAKNYTKIYCPDSEEFKNNKKKYDKYDIVYNIDRNYGTSYHLITIYKQPNDISDRRLAEFIDGFFWDVTRCGNTLSCYFD